ncbi:GH12390 [Drosophila grimshawi]|uniref:GH12390 n=1 Tax=Drosophila grimshawi TaxID=7222 RepID=B4JIV0_DROGR|nr:GH12390 [Drosophila grimshawi]
MLYFISCDRYEDDDPPGSFWRAVALRRHTTAPPILRRLLQTSPSSTTIANSIINNINIINNGTTNTAYSINITNSPITTNTNSIINLITTTTINSVVINVISGTSTQAKVCTGMALKWYIANNQHWTRWVAFVQSFQKYFLPRDYFENLKDEVTRRRQVMYEPFKLYMVEMQTLMRPLQYSAEKKKSKMYNYSLPDLRAYARPYQFNNLAELMHLAEAFEELKADREKLRQQSRMEQPRYMESPRRRMEPPKTRQEAPQYSHREPAQRHNRPRFMAMTENGNTQPSVSGADRSRHETQTCSEDETRQHTNTYKQPKECMQILWPGGTLCN